MGCFTSDIDNLMPADEFQAWMAYYQLEPFGAWRDNFHSATISAVVANVNRNPKRPPLGAKDFMFKDPKTQKLEKAQTMKERLRSKADGN